MLFAEKSIRLISCYQFMTGDQVDISVNVRAIMSISKLDPLEVAFKYPHPAPVVEIQPDKRDPDHVAVQLTLHEPNNRQFVLNMLITKDYAKQLDLMVGDKLTLRLIKEQSNRVNVPID